MTTLSNVKSEILVQAYSFTSKPIAKALVDAHKRGVHTKLSLINQIYGINIAPQILPAIWESRRILMRSTAIAHNKIMIIDKEVVITGSFNFTRAAEEKNAENLLIIRSKELAKEYFENWEKHKAHSEEYRGR